MMSCSFRPGHFLDLLGQERRGISIQFLSVQSLQPGTTYTTLPQHQLSWVDKAQLLKPYTKSWSSLWNYNSFNYVCVLLIILEAWRVLTKNLNTHFRQGCPTPMWRFWANSDLWRSGVLEPLLDSEALDYGNYPSRKFSPWMVALGKLEHEVSGPKRCLYWYLRLYFPLIQHPRPPWILESGNLAVGDAKLIPIYFWGWWWCILLDQKVFTESVYESSLLNKQELCLGIDVKMTRIVPDRWCVVLRLFITE